MKVTITQIILKSPLHFFKLSAYALGILKQLKKTNVAAFKKTGFWTTHYTMTLWNSEEELRSFSAGGAHLEAMKNSRLIAKEIKTITVDADQLPDWNTAKNLLKNGKVVKY